MLTEFEKQLDYLFKQHDNKNLNDEECLTHINKLYKAWGLKRLDFKNNGTSQENSIKYLEYERFALTSFPKWFVDERGKGSIITYRQASTSLLIKCVHDGILEIICRGIDFNNYDQKRVPVYTNYTKITLNDEVLLEENRLTWHNSPLKFNTKCFDAQIMYLQVESGTIFDYYPELNVYMQEFKNNLQKTYKKLKKFIKNNR